MGAGGQGQSLAIVTCLVKGDLSSVYTGTCLVKGCLSNRSCTM